MKLVDLNKITLDMVRTVKDFTNTYCPGTSEAAIRAAMLTPKSDRIDWVTLGDSTVLVVLTTKTLNYSPRAKNGA